MLQQCTSSELHLCGSTLKMELEGWDQHRWILYEGRLGISVQGQQRGITEVTTWGGSPGGTGCKDLATCMCGQRNAKVNLGMQDGSLVEGCLDAVSQGNAQ